MIQSNSMKPVFMQFILLILLLVSCDGPREEKRKKIWKKSSETPTDTETKLAPPPNPTKNPNLPPAQPSKIPQLTGLWKSGCLMVKKTSDKGIVTQKFQKTQIQFSNDTALHVTDLYKSKDCVGLSYTIFVYSKVATSLSHLSTEFFNMDLTLVKIELVPRTQNDADEAVDVDLYGLKTWDKNMPTEITGRRESADQEPLPNPGRVLYDIFNVQNQILRFGLSANFVGTNSDGQTPEKRPRAINDDVQFKAL